MRNRRGFTIIEGLVALAIVLLMAVFALWIYCLWKLYTAQTLEEILRWGFFVTALAIGGCAGSGRKSND